jgi:hypothetical protein
MLKTVSSITNAIGALNYKGTWNASTNTPALASGAGTNGDYYVVSVAGSTALDGLSNWGIGDWAVFNGSVWQRVEGGADLNGVNLSYTGTLTGGTGAITIGTDQIIKDVNGDVLLGTTTMANGRVRIQIKSGVSDLGVAIKALNDGNYAAGFYNSANSLVGSIVINTGSTSYNTLSDHRLKENIQPMTGALERLAALKPVTYKWKADGSDGEGFIAHELAVVCPAAVTGEKDAVDADGRPKYQGIDVSFLVGMLTAAIQEQQASIEQLKAEIAILKGA